jgi:hypothetical protein
MRLLFREATILLSLLPFSSPHHQKFYLKLYETIYKTTDDVVALRQILV